MGREGRTASVALGPSDSVGAMIKWLKDKLDDATESQDSAEPEGGEVSQGPNSFSDAETSTGGADSTYGTPDATPSTVLGDEEPPAAPGAS